MCYRYVHYKVDGPTVPLPKEIVCAEEKKVVSQEATILYPPQWVQCDLRYLDMTVLGREMSTFVVITLIFII